MAAVRHLLVSGRGPSAPKLPLPPGTGSKVPDGFNGDGRRDLVPTLDRNPEATATSAGSSRDMTKAGPEAPAPNPQSLSSRVSTHSHTRQYG